MTTPHPISINHPDYEAAKPKWERCRDACGGTDRIKAAGAKYLPPLSSHTKDGQEGADKYDAYLKRALWYNASRRTRFGLSGAATLKPVRVTTTQDPDLYRHLVVCVPALMDEIIEVGRFALVVNQEEGEEPYVTKWWAENVVNWSFEENEGTYRLTMLVLEHEDTQPTDSVFKHEKRLTRTAYALDTNGQCVSSKFYKDKDDWIESQPWTHVKSVGGATLDHVPAVIVNPMAVNEPYVEDPLLLDLVDVNISHYQNSADLEHGRHWTALPTAYAVGFPTTTPDGQPVKFTVGGESAWITEQPNASAGYLEFTGAGLNHLQTGMTEKQAMMAVLGARLLEEQKPSVESDETIKTRLTGEKSVLSRVAATVSQALTWALRELIRFKKPTYEPTEEQDTMRLNTDFLARSLSPAQLDSLTRTLQAGGISYQSYFALLQAAEVVPEGKPIEEEMEDIEAGRPGGQEDPLVTPPIEGGAPVEGETITDDDATTVNELSLAIERLARIKDEGMINVMRMMLADRLGVKVPGKYKLPKEQLA